jgi:Mce-associated membrane protein
MRSVLTRWRSNPLVAALSVVTVLVVAGLLVLGTIYYQRAQASADRDAAREGALGAARQVSLALTTIDAGTVDRNVDQLTKSAADSFKPQLTQQADSIRQVVTQSKVSSRGTVGEAAVSRSDGDTAVVLTAVQATVSNAETPQGQERQYRFRISLRHSGDQWLVSNLEFVP